MSIALEVKVQALERRAAALEAMLVEALNRIALLETKPDPRQNQIEKHERPERKRA